KTMRINYSGALGHGVTPKDLILATIGRLGTGGMVGHAVEYAGPAIRDLSMPGRMTVCNMTIEGGGRAGMIAPDEATFEWVQGRGFGSRDGRSRLATGQSAGGGRGPRRSLPRRGLRMARGRLLDVPRDEPRHACRGRALRFDFEPQLRGAPGEGRPDPPGQPE